MTESIDTFLILYFSHIQKLNFLAGLIFFIFQDFILQQMCERLVDIINPDDWTLIAQRLGLQKDALLLIEKEMPGDKNFRQRVSRALEYWSGFTFSENSLKGKTPVQAFPVSAVNLTIHKTRPSTTEDMNKVN